jgi:hypothetical protein
MKNNMKNTIDMIAVEMNTVNWLDLLGEVSDYYLDVNIFHNMVKDIVYLNDDKGYGYDRLEAYDRFYSEIVKEILTNEITKDIGSPLVKYAVALHKISIDVVFGNDKSKSLRDMKYRLGLLSSEYSDEVNVLLLLVDFLKSKGGEEDDFQVAVGSDLMFRVLEQFLSNKSDKKKVKAMKNLLDETLFK